jgi:acetyl-CoA carboxylase biotin carboxyl carrier protein
MTMDDIKALIDAMGASDLAEMEVVKDGWTLRLRRAAAFRPDVAASADASPHAAPPGPVRPRPLARGPAADGTAAPAAHEVRAPLSGMVYLAPAPNAPPFVTVGQTVEAGAILCTVEAMKTFNEVRTEWAGIVEAVLVAQGDEVEAGQPLLRIG